ncbi:MAG: hypothetical protein OEY86_18810 [Nitrospira sp.]|nr:hypothetical protein [Nitrospira sp.]
MFGGDMKVSLHKTGECQFSATDAWVKRQQNATNAQRHVHRWRVAQPDGHEALLVFRVEIPVSELRLLPEPKDKKKVWWVGGAPQESTVRFLFYLTRPSEADPAPPPSPQTRHLFSLRLRGSRWLVALVEMISIPVADLAALRKAVIEQSRSWGLVAPAPEHRASLFIQPPPEGGAHGLLELCLI